MNQSSIMIPVPNSPGTELHLKRFFTNPEGPPVFLLHGAVENGRVFYSRSGKGLAPYLAHQGFDVFVGDLRGKGGSTPKIARGHEYGQTEAIREDLPAFVDEIIKLRGPVPQHWIAHSWGGVLMMSYLAHTQRHLPLVKSMVFFGTKRSIHSRNLKKFLMMDMLFGKAAFLLSHLHGYYPATKVRFGSDEETMSFHRGIHVWAGLNPWHDLKDGFDYSKAIENLDLPPVLSFAAVNDPFLGNPRDVQTFLKECKAKKSKYQLLSKATGNLHDYDHVSMLTHPDAGRDHFLSVDQWLRGDC